MLLGLVFGLILTGNRLLADAPAGFQDPNLLKAVMEGKIVRQDVVNSKLEYRTVLRSFFRKVSPEAYASLAVNYEKYPALFSEIKEARMTSANAERTVFTYWADMLVKVGFFSTHVYPEGRHTIYPAPDTKSEARIVHEIINYQEDLEKAVQTARLIPYQDGILVEDDVHVKLRKDSIYSGAVKEKISGQMMRMTETFRRELKGNP